MRDGCRRKEKEEVTNPFLSIHRAVWRKVNSIVSDMKKQAPAARMVGEFAVKHVASEANKNIRKVTDQSPPASE